MDSNSVLPNSYASLLPSQEPIHTSTFTNTCKYRAAQTFNFGHSVPGPRPRAWERAPRSSHLARHKGRKVWKREDDLAKPFVETGAKGFAEGERNPLRDISSNTPRPVKKLRLKDGASGTEESPSAVPMKYFATLRDALSGTPRRESASRMREFLCIC